jgi:hypothetical protein
MNDAIYEPRVRRGGWVRKLVIGLSLMTCVFLIAAWVRSYRIQDNLTINCLESFSLFAASANGRVSVSKRWPISYPNLITIRHTNPGVGFGSGYPDDFGRSPTLWWFRVLRWKGGNQTELSSPYWLLVLIPGTTWVLSTRKRQFSL